MVVVVDDEDRENEGDLVMAAEFVSADDINFMATHARGWICLALTPERCDELDLELMSLKNETAHQTPFTVTIEAREGVTTGISAADRAHTIRVAALQAYCFKQGLRMTTIADLIAYRRRNDKLIERVVATSLPTTFGDFEVIGYRSLMDDKHHVALVKGDVDGAQH